MTLRHKIQTLPFVREIEGRLDYWAVQASGNTALDFDTGRVYGALFQHFVRENNAPHLAHYVSSAWDRGGVSNITPMIDGFLFESRESLSHAPEDATPALLMVSRRPTPDSFEAAALQMPFVRRKSSGEIDYFSYRVTGDWSQDTATGRHYAAHMAAHYRKFRDRNLFRLIRESRERNPSLDAAAEAVHVGVRTHLAEIAMAAPPCVTEHQALTLDLHRLRHSLEV